MTAKEEKDLEILNRVLDGESVQKIADDLGTSIMRIYRVIRARELQRVYVTPEETDVLRKLRQNPHI